MCCNNSELCNARLAELFSFCLDPVWCRDQRRTQLYIEILGFGKVLQVFIAVVTRHPACGGPPGPAGGCCTWPAYTCRPGPDGEIGRHSGLKIRRLLKGSVPVRPRLGAPTRPWHRGAQTKSPTSASEWGFVFLEARPGVEPGWTDLQSGA